MWITLAGGMLKVSPGLYELAVHSAKRHPTARITSALRASSFPQVDPFEPP